MLILLHKLGIVHIGRQISVDCRVSVLLVEGEALALLGEVAVARQACQAQQHVAVLANTAVGLLPVVDLALARAILGQLARRAVAQLELATGGRHALAAEAYEWLLLALEIGIGEQLGRLLLHLRQRRAEHVAVAGPRDHLFDLHA